MVLIKRLTGIEEFDFDRGAVIVQAKETNFAAGYVRGEIGIIAYEYSDYVHLVVVMTGGGYNTRSFATIKQLFDALNKDGQFDFFYIEIKP